MVNVTIGSIRTRLGIVVGCVVLLWVIFGHLLCSCCVLNRREGFELASAIAGAPTVDSLMRVVGLSPSSSPSPSAPAQAKKAPSAPAQKEGFVQQLRFSSVDTPDTIVDPSLWASPSLVFKAGSTPTPAVQAILDRPAQPIPAPSGNFFATTEFKPECCPNEYSTSSGCACMTMDQYAYLRNRGNTSDPHDDDF